MNSKIVIRTIIIIHFQKKINRYLKQYIYIYIYMCVFTFCPDYSKSKFEKKVKHNIGV